MTSMKNKGAMIAFQSRVNYVACVSVVTSKVTGNLASYRLTSNRKNQQPRGRTLPLNDGESDARSALVF